MKKSYVHIKGTKEGLVLRLDDQCAYADLVNELEKKILEGGIDGKVDVLLYLGYRYCTAEQKKELMSIVHKSGSMIVSKVQSEVLSIEESNRKLQQQKIETYVGVVRSGQIVKSTGDIIVLGDVNPNGRIEAGGNIYVVGKLKGSAHAGIEGNASAIVAASHFAPTHVGIAEQIVTMTNEQPFVQERLKELCAYMNELGEIDYTHIQQMKKYRPFFNTVKGGS